MIYTNKRRIIILNGSNLLVFIFIVLSAVLFSGVYYNKSKDSAAGAFSNNTVVDKNSYKGFLLSSIDSSINEAVENFYGEHKEFVYKEIIKTNRIGGEGDKMEIIAKVAVKNDESKYSYSVGTITLIKNGNDVEVKEYRHDNTGMLKIINRQ